VPSCTQWREPPFHINFLPEKLKTYIKRKWKVKRKKKESKWKGKSKHSASSLSCHWQTCPPVCCYAVNWHFPFHERGFWFHAPINERVSGFRLSVALYLLYFSPSVTPKQYKVTLRFCCNCHFIFQLKYSNAHILSPSCMGH